MKKKKIKKLGDNYSAIKEAGKKIVEKRVKSTIKKTMEFVAIRIT